MGETKQRKGEPLPFGRVADGAGGSSLHPSRAMKVSVSLTIAQWEAICSAARAALTPGDEWSDYEDNGMQGAEREERKREVERADHAHDAIFAAIALARGGK